MFPWVFGFSWTLGNIIFLGIFFMIVVIIGSTVLLSLLRAYRRMQAHHADVIAAINKAFPGSVTLTGQTPLKVRQENIDKFEKELAVQKQKEAQLKEKLEQAN